MLKKCLLLMLCLIITFSVSSCGDEEDNISDLDKSQNVNKISNVDQKQLIKQGCKNIYDSNTEYLILVNRDNPLSESYETELTSTKSGRVQMEVQTYNALVELLAEGETAGHTFWISSGYRSRETQQGLINSDVQAYISAGANAEEALEKTYRQTMPVGCSEHETGLAIDILDSLNPNMDETQADGEANIWLRTNCYKYGFILRYPKGKEDITGIDYEPWHFRYVGREAAEFMYMNDLTLEELIQYATN